MINEEITGVLTNKKHDTQFGHPYDSWYGNLRFNKFDLRCNLIYWRMSVFRVEEEIRCSSHMPIVLAHFHPKARCEGGEKSNEQPRSSSRNKMKQWRTKSDCACTIYTSSVPTEEWQTL